MKPLFQKKSTAHFQKHHKILELLQYWLTTSLILKNFKSFSVIKIEFYLQDIYKNLDRLDKNHGLSLKELEKFVKYVDFYLSLIRQYYDLLANAKNKNIKISEELIACILCKFLHNIGLIFLNQAEHKTQSLPGLWALCYRVFKIAEDVNLLHTRVRLNQGYFSISTLFKQLVIFQILDTDYLTLEETKKIFHSLVRIIHYIELKKSLNAHSNRVVIGFHLEKDEPPARLNYLANEMPDEFRYMDTVDIMRVIRPLLKEENQRIHLINHQLFLRVFTPLAQQKYRRYTRINKIHRCRGIFELEQVMDFLLEQKEKSLSKGIPQQHYDHPPTIKYAPYEGTILDNSINGYAIFWDSQSEMPSQPSLKIGEIVGIIPDFQGLMNNLEIGLVRRISQRNVDKTFGVELIGLSVTLAYIERVNYPESGEWMIFLHGSPAYGVSLLCRKDALYQVGDLIFVQVNEKRQLCRLGNIVNSSSTLNQMLLSYE